MRKTSIFIVTIWGFLAISSSCSEDLNSDSKTPQKQLSRTEKLKAYCSIHQQNLHDFLQIVVINEIGSCINCNNIFAKSQTQNLNSDSTLFIVSGIGNKVDLSAYIDKKSAHLIFDESQSFDSLKIVKSCAIISLKNDTIYRIEEIDINNVHDLSLVKF